MKRLLVSLCLLLLASCGAAVAFAAEASGPPAFDLLETIKGFFNGNVTGSTVALGLGGYSMLEAWVGKTNWLKENSVPAVLATFFLALLKGGFPAAIGATFRKLGVEDGNGGGGVGGVAIGGGGAVGGDS